MILEALIQGGWQNQQDEEDDKDKSSDNDSSEHQLVKSILKGSEEGQMVQSALQT